MFEVNQKVVPIKKTVDGYGNLESSSVWLRAQEIGQNFLYFLGKDFEEDDFYVCSESPSDEVNGDYFNLSDLVPYEGDNK